MHVFLLISGILLLPQACSLKCYQCEHDHDGNCEEYEHLCSADYTRCGITRRVTYRGNIKVRDFIKGSCFKVDKCKNVSTNNGMEMKFFVTMCCDTDNCNTNWPPPPLKIHNRRKCNICDDYGNCNGTIDCVGDQFYCATVAGLKSCVNEAFCFDSQSSEKDTLTKVGCVRNRSSADLLLLSTLLPSLLLSLLWK